MTTEAPPRTRYRTSDMLPLLMEAVRCCTKAEVRAWAEHAEPSYEHKTALKRMFCNDCTSDFMVMREREGLCRRHEINGAGWEPEADDRDFEAVG